MTCQRCSGSGWLPAVDERGPRTCDECDGYGITFRNVVREIAQRPSVDDDAEIDSNSSIPWQDGFHA
jgi:hypothetical protein